MTITPELAAEISQQHEAWLTQLEGLAVEAIASGNWDAVYQHIATMQPKLTWQDVLPPSEANDVIAFINRLLGE